MAHLLIVDDEPGNLLTLSALLEDEGFVVDSATTCAEARALIEASTDRTYAAVLLDAKLPDGHGIDLAPLVRACSPATKIILVTGAPDQSLVGNKVDAVFAKGNDVEALLHLLAACLTAATGG